MYSSLYSLSKTKVVYLALAVWVHVTLLNLFAVTLEGPIFFWAESVELKTLFIHLFISMITVVVYLSLHQARLAFQANNQFNNKALASFLTVILVLAILVVLI
jgi:hypothetical protein